jgi:L-fuconolactonase
MREMPAAIATAQAFPQGRFVLDHAAKPPIAEGFSRDWADLLAALAACGNVWCKISGLATEARWNDWHAEHLLPFIAHAAKCFGEDRLIFGSDWPVCLLAGSYGVTKGALEECLTKLGPHVRDKAFGANASAVLSSSFSPCGERRCVAPDDGFKQIIRLLISGFTGMRTGLGDGICSDFANT